jgi:SAM-dependent methyltransferase
MHKEARNFTIYIKKNFPQFFKNCNVLDVGAGDINGNNRFLFDDCKYEGNDVYNAPNITIISKTKDLPFQDECFDVIVSTECFEHDPEYNESILKIYKMLKPGGLLFFTCASTGRPEHGTRRTTPKDSIGTIGGILDMQDYYKNLTILDIKKIIDLDLSFSYWNSYYNSKSFDLYFVGIKRNILESSMSSMSSMSSINTEDYKDKFVQSTKNDPKPPQPQQKPTQRRIVYKKIGLSRYMK